MQIFNHASLLGLGVFALVFGSSAQVSTNKLFVIGTNNVLPPNETNFFAANSNLLNASVAASSGGGSGGGGPTYSFASPIVTNASGQISIAGTVSNLANQIATALNLGGATNIPAAQLTGTASINTTGTASGFTGSLFGNVTGTQSATVVSSVGSASLPAAQLTGTMAQAVLPATAATNDANGNGLYVTDISGMPPNQSSLSLTNKSEGPNNSSGLGFDVPGNAYLTAPGMFYLTRGGFRMANGSFYYKQTNGSPSYVLGNTNGNQGDIGAFQELLDLMPADYLHFYPDDLLVFSGNSNNANIRPRADGTLHLGGIRYNTTNVSGLPAYQMLEWDKIVLCNPAAASCVITMPAEAVQNLVLNTNSQPFSPWTAKNAYANDSLGNAGNPLMPQQTTMEYWVKNLGSNTANTLTVNLPWAATNIGATSLVIPNQTAAHFTCTGTNGGVGIAVEFLPMTLAPAYSVANMGGTLPQADLPSLAVTNFNAAALSLASNLWVGATNGMNWLLCSNNAGFLGSAFVANSLYVSLAARANTLYVSNYFSSDGGLIGSDGSGDLAAVSVTATGTAGISGLLKATNAAGYGFLGSNNAPTNMPLANLSSGGAANGQIPQFNAATGQWGVSNAPSGGGGYYATVNVASNANAVVIGTNTATGQVTLTNMYSTNPPAFFTNLAAPPMMGAGGTNLWFNAGATNYFQVNLTNSVSFLNGPTNALYDRELVTLEFIQDATGNRTLLYNTGQSTGNIVPTTAVPGINLSTNANYHDFVLLRYNLAHQNWILMGNNWGANP